MVSTTKASAEKIITEADLDTVLEKPKSELDRLYRSWCISNPDKLAQLDISISNTEEIKEIIFSIVKQYDQTAPDLFDALLTIDVEKDKSDGTSIKYREEGNQLYQKKKFTEALKSYNKSISYAHENSILALGYANRSAVLFQMGEFKPCIIDVDRAFEKGYPMNLCHKLHDRRGKSCMKINCYEEAIKDLKKANELARQHITEESKLNVFVKDIDKSLHICSTKMDKSQALNLQVKNTPMLTGKNDSMPALSQAVKIEYSAEKGRHAIALRKIECGEIILIEQTHFNAINYEKRGLICTNCLDFLVNPICSPLNTTDVFCSEFCLKEAMEFYHQNESSLIQALGCIAEQEWNAAFRAVLRRPLSYFLDHRKEIFNVYDKKYGSELPEGDIYLSEDYKALNNLVTTTGHWYLERLHYKSFVVWFYIQCLRKIKYFDTNTAKKHDTSGEMTRDEFYIASILVHFMNVASTNAIEIASYVIEPNSKSWMEGQVTPCGASINPVVSLLNHSCDPNISRLQNGRRTIAIANRTIKENEEITNIYFIGYWEKDIKTRSAYISSRYQFQCDCNPCSKGWLTNEDLPKGFNDLLPNQLKTDDSDPKLLMQQVTKIQKLGSNISLEQKNGNYKKAYSYCVEFIRVLEETLHRPHCYYLMAEKSLFKLANILYGTTIVQ